MLMLQGVTISPLYSQGSKPKSYAEREAYAVYAAILQDEWPNSDRFFISDQTFPFHMCLKPDAQAQAILGSAFDNYAEANRQLWTLKPQFHMGTPYELVSAEDPINKRRTNPLPITFSAVGFNKKKTLAVIGVKFGIDGEILVLTKKNKKWQPTKGFGGCAWAP
jgi:hypothetical protein